VDGKGARAPSRGDAPAADGGLRPRLSECKHIFLTGATGFLGIHLLDQLLSAPSAPTVHCLVRVSRGGRSSTSSRASSGGDDESKSTDMEVAEGPPVMRRESSDMSHHARDPSDDEGESAMLKAAIGEALPNGSAEANIGLDAPPAMRRTLSAEARHEAAQVVAQGRLEETARGAGILLDGDRAGRAIAVAGDLEAERFGMAPEDFDDLAQTIDGVMHCAAIVHWLKSYTDLRAANVQGTE